MFTRKLSFTKPPYPKAKSLGITVFPYEEFNSNGKLSYWEDSNGRWYICEYDSNANRTYYEDSLGYWEKAKFDSNSNRTYFDKGRIILLE